MNIVRGLLTTIGLLLALGTGTQAATTDASQRARLEKLFRQGMQALREDRLQTAIRAFNSILTTDPSLHRARLELAVAYYRSLRYAEARRLAQKVLADPTTPPEVRVTILAFLAQLDKEEKQVGKRHEFKPRIALGLMYDSNVNVGPSSDVVEINGQIVPLVGGRQQSSNALVLEAGFSHRFQPGRTFHSGERTGSFQWLSDVNLYDREYKDQHAFDLSVLTASTGPAWVVVRHWRAALNLRADQIWLGNTNLALFGSINPLVTWQFHNGEFTLDASYTHRRYDKSADSGREGNYKTAGLALGHYYRHRTVATQVGVRGFDFNAKEARFANNGWEAYLGTLLTPWRGGRVYVRLNYRSLNYDGVEPLFNVARDETEKRAVIGFEHDFRGGRLDKWSLAGDFTYTTNDSNVPIYDYNRRQVSLRVSRRF